jgi:hypothetical protein
MARVNQKNLGTIMPILRWIVADNIVINPDVNYRLGLADLVVSLGQHESSTIHILEPLIILFLSAQISQRSSDFYTHDRMEKQIKLCLLRIRVSPSTPSIWVSTIVSHIES